jgi:hypothetical protein
MGGQGPLLILHLKKYVPGIKPLITDEADAGATIVGELGPLISDQVPVPIAGTLPAIVTEEEHTVWSGPAFGIDGLSNMVI